MSRRTRVYGAWLIVLGCIRCGAAADTVELPTPETLNRVIASQSTDELRRAFAPLARVAVLGPEYRPSLRKALASDDRQLRRIAALGLSASGEQDEAVLKTLLEALADRGRSYPLEEDLIVERGLTAQGLRALPIWRAALRLDSPTARYRALVAVAKLGPEAKAALPDVTPLVRTPADETTNLAIFARWRLDGDDAKAARQLAELLSKKRERQCNGAVDRLAAMGPAAREAIPTLIAALREHGDAQVLLALESLFPHFPAQIRPVLLDALDDLRLANLAAAALQHREGPRDYLLPHLVRMMNAEGDQAIERHVLASILAEYGAKAAPAVPGLTRELRSLSGQVRINAAEALGQIGPAARDALPALRAAQNDPVVAPAATAAIARVDKQE